MVWFWRFSWLNSEELPENAFRSTHVHLASNTIQVIGDRLPTQSEAQLWKQLGRSVADYFDLIVGTSTGGIIALGLGLGLSANDLLRFYEEHGPGIFNGNGRVRWIRQFFRAKYNPEPLRRSLSEAYGPRRLGDSRKRLVIPL
jgi:patatin-like phospholipase/acyl hydrolase